MIQEAVASLAIFQPIDRRAKKASPRVIEGCAGEIVSRPSQERA